MKYEPYAYQQYAIDSIKTRPTCALMLDMGLGKTVITLTAIRDLMAESREPLKALVIAPLRVARSIWPQEAQKWDHLKQLRLSLALGTEAERRQALNTPADIYVINRENVHWLVRESHLPFDYDIVVLDELSSFKNPLSQCSRALMTVRPGIKRIIGLTGTPSDNELMDLWAEFRLLDMGQRLGRNLMAYRNTFFNLAAHYGALVYSYKPKYGAEQAIYRRISDITISMKAVGCPPMPRLVYNNYLVNLTPREAEQYEAIKKQLALPLPGGEIPAEYAPVLRHDLLQLANGAAYDGDYNAIPLHDHKLDALEDMIEAAAGKPLLVAYTSPRDLQRIRERLQKLKLVYGTLDSDECITRWNAGQLAVGLIRSAAAGYGPEVRSRGGCLVWFGLPWDPEKYQQTNDRLCRRKKAETLVICHLLTRGSLDERMLQVLQAKDVSQAALIEAVKAELHLNE